MTFLAFSWLLSILFPTIDKVLAIMGGLCAASLDYAIPMFCYVKLSDQHWTHPKNLACIIFFGALTLVGYTAVVVTIWEMATGNDTFKSYEKSKN